MNPNGILWILWVTASVFSLCPIRNFQKQPFTYAFVLKIFSKLTGKHQCRSLAFNKVVGLRPATVLKKETVAQVFSCKFCEIFMNNFFTDDLQNICRTFLQNIFYRTTTSKYRTNILHHRNCHRNFLVGLFMAF